jgi:tetratricopeptide (TPR) repeat protein
LLAQKKKITKKQLKEDSLVTFYYKAVKYFEDNMKPILIIGGAVVVLAVLVYLYSVKLKNDNEKAAVELSRVVGLYEMGNYQEAIDGKKGTNILGLKQIVESYGSTENGEIAKVYLANAYLYLGKIEEAYEYYDDYSGDSPLYKATALAGIAGYYEYKKEYEKAAEKYKEAAYVSKENALNPQYLLSAVINYVNVKQYDSAKELIDKIKEDYKTSDVMRDIDKYSFLVKE